VADKRLDHPAGILISDYCDDEPHLCQTSRALDPYLLLEATRAEGNSLRLESRRYASSECLRG
jgi:hypothetical protein